MKIALSLLCAAAFAVADDAKTIVTVDHYVNVKSTVPAMGREQAMLYVREVVQAGTALRSASPADRVVLFVHGAGTPSSVAYDVAHSSYSWMRHLAAAGYDVFAMDHTGYGRSTRPAPMNDPCNLAPDLQKVLGRATPCAPSYPFQLTSIGSDWADIDAVVNHILALRHVSSLAIVGWSLGGPRAGGYTARHPEKINKLILLAPFYNRNSPNEPAKLPAAGTPMEIRTQGTFMENWTRQVGCAGQIPPGVAEAVWKQMQDSDPQAATWGPTGARRAPLVTNHGWNQADAAKIAAPALIVSPALDAQVRPEMVRSLFSDLGSPKKVLLDLGCTSHNALWEANHNILFDASLEFLRSGSVQGKSEGTVKAGY